MNGQQSLRTPRPILVDHPAVTDPTLLDFALGIQAMLVRSLWEAELPALPGIVDDPDDPQFLAAADFPRSADEAFAELAARGVLAGRVLQVGVHRDEWGLELSATFFDGDDPVPVELVVEAGAAPILDGLRELVAFALMHAAPSTQAKIDPARLDLLEIWGEREAAGLVLSLTRIGASCRMDHAAMQADPAWLASRAEDAPPRRLLN